MDNFSQLSSLIDEKYREIDRLERKKSQIWSELHGLEALASAVYCRDADISEWAELSRLDVPQTLGIGFRSPNPLRSN